MTKEIMFSIVGLFLITALTNVLATLKTMLMSKNIMNPVYILVFVDAMIFATIVSKVTSSNGLHFTIAFAFGKMVGVIIGGIIENKIALGIIEIDLFLNHKEKMVEVANKLRSVGYTVNNFRVQGNNEDTRYKVEVVIKRNEFHIFQDVLSKCDVNNPTLKVKNLSKVNGKITTTRVQTI